ncbi:nucleotidyltransferase family protein [Nitrospirillum iridis]|uniref:Nucleotidyltransferase family protein n=1 Tax=Nitrospirillum iridis TaxID=765888 RepID=A0A7X0AZN5_9PROT|nr:nucleotidyltransferase family protein [Nitrospirillum iridis]MBB6252296.1 hypothetical protein [Nitrospirillum iridis]
MSPQTHKERLEVLIRRDGARLCLLRHVRTLDLPDCWIGAGFVRNAVWCHLHSQYPAPPSADAVWPDSDVDVVWFDDARQSVALDRDLTDRLAALEPGVRWSVKNQARMSGRNGDAPYASAADALRHWPETATAVAVRLTAADELEILAPYGLDDLFGRVIRPTPPFRGVRLDIVRQRVRDKRWLDRWPLLRVVEA